jgi:hypothetical protein
MEDRIQKLYKEDKLLGTEYSATYDHKGSRRKQRQHLYHCPTTHKLEPKLKLKRKERKGNSV